MKMWKMFWILFKIGLFTIGGGVVMISIMQDEFVNRQKWVTDEEIVDIFALSQALPGVIAINSSIFIGHRLFGVKGAVVAALAIILPSFLIILVIAAFLLNIGENVWISKFFLGVRAALVAMVFTAIYKLGRGAIRDWFGIVAALAAFLLIIVLDVNIILVIIAGALAGIVYYGLVAKEGIRQAKD